MFMAEIYYFQEDTVLVFPGPDSFSLSELKNKASKNSKECEFQFRRIVFIDSTWNQCHAICQDERIKSLDKVILNTLISEGMLLSESIFAFVRKCCLFHSIFYVIFAYFCYCQCMFYSFIAYGRFFESLFYLHSR